MAAPTDRHILSAAADPDPLRGEFGGRQLWKRSLETKDPDEARRMFATINAELETLFAQAREAITQRAVSSKLTAQTAADAVARIAKTERGSRVERLPVLANIYWAEEAAASIMPGVCQAISGCASSVHVRAPTRFSWRST